MIVRGITTTFFCSNNDDCCYHDQEGKLFSQEFNSKNFKIDIKRAIKEGWEVPSDELGKTYCPYCLDNKQMDC